MTEGLVDAIWSQACQASDFLALFVPPSSARGSPDGTGEE
jgi:hypothetical protein